jgi:hypothetical protein
LRNKTLSLFVLKVVFIKSSEWNWYGDENVINWLNKIYVKYGLGDKEFEEFHCEK